jgi:mono/diheme cytochrome c family protein
MRRRRDPTTVGAPRATAGLRTQSGRGSYQAMRSRRCAALVFLAVAAGRVAAADSAPELHFVRDGAPVRTVDLAALKANCQVQTVTIDDPYYGRRKSFLACPLGDVLRFGFGEPPDALAAHTFLLRARDGYTRPASGTRLVEPGGYLAFADAEHAHGDAPGWEPIERKQLDPGPYYLVWSLPQQSDPHQYPWPYQLTTIEITSLDSAFPHTVPQGAAADSPARAGYDIFRTQCIACHAINREGGTVGPDLNLPKSIVEYRPLDQIKQYIRDPGTFRYSNMPANPQLTDQQLDELIAYFTAMQALKHDPGHAP